MFPGTRGGIEWGGAAFDPATNLLYFRSNDAPDIQTIIKGGIDAQDMTLLEQGQTLYTTYCASCHGAEKKGNPPTYPSLVDLKDRMTREVVLEKIQKGAGVMPGYASVLSNDQQNAILAFIHELPTNAEQAGKVEEKQTQNTPARYLNTTGYITWKDPSGNPALAPPWGTLHALNLSTGEYEWQIPFGNDQQRQIKIPLEGATGLNDITVDRKGILYVSDSRLGKVFKIEEGVGKVHLSDLEDANGLKVIGKDLYILTATGVFKSSSGKSAEPIAKMEIGGDDYIVSCWPGLIYYLNRNREIQLLLDTRSQKKYTADIGYDPIHRIIFVPTLMRKTVVAYNLK